VIRIGGYNKMTFIFSPGSSSVSKIEQGEEPEHDAPGPHGGSPV